MNAIILGSGGFGRAIAAALIARGEPEPRVLGRPAGGRHDSGDIAGPFPEDAAEAAVVFDASRGDAVPGNVAAALAAGRRRFVIGTTVWDEARPAVDRMLREHGATAVAASNLSLGVALFGRLVDRAVELFGPVEAFDPYIVEWHRRTKVDRPSGTAKELSRRILAAHPRKTRLADPRRDGPPEPDELDVAVIRAGGNPGSHLVGFDGMGESVELRIVARDRSAYALGALAAADWLGSAPRSPGIHAFDEVVDDFLGRTARQASPPVLVALPG
jgi:4-hydroxy-tetrahydrodipicolinate reductase